MVENIQGDREGEQHGDLDTDDETTVGGTLRSLINSIVSAGVLALAFEMSKSGFVAVVALMVFCASALSLTMYYLFKVSQCYRYPPNTHTHTHTLSLALSHTNTHTCAHTHTCLHTHTRIPPPHTQDYTVRAHGGSGTR